MLNLTAYHLRFKLEVQTTIELDQHQGAAFLDHTRRYLLDEYPRKLRKTLEETMGEDQSPFSRLFNKLNPDKWSAEDIAKFVRTDVEMTTPGHYANSGWFESEFRKICSWRDFS